METPEGSKLGGRGASGEAFDGDAMVRDGGVSVPIAVLAEDEVVGVAADGDRAGGTVIADLRAQVLAREEVSGVDVLIAEQAELGGVSSAIKNGCLLGAEVAWNALSGLRFGGNHLCYALFTSQNQP